MNEDDKQLRLLSILHYVLGGLTALVSCIGFLYAALGVAVLSHSMPSQPNSEPPPDFVGWMFLVMGAMIVLLGWAYSIGLIVAGRAMTRHKSRMFCLVMAGISCLNVPFGTALGAFTFVVLMRDSVKSLFDREKMMAQGPGLA